MLQYKYMPSRSYCANLHWTPTHLADQIENNGKDQNQFDFNHEIVFWMEIGKWIWLDHKSRNLQCHWQVGKSQTTLPDQASLSVVNISTFDHRDHRDHRDSFRHFERWIGWHSRIRSESTLDTLYSDGNTQEAEINSQFKDRRPRTSFWCATYWLLAHRYVW